MKMFVSFKNSRTFAPYFAKVCFSSISVLAFFNVNTATANVANIIGYHNPAVCYTEKNSKCTLASKGGDSLSYFITNKYFHSQMPKYNENVNAMNNSNCIDTPCSATSAQSSLLELLPKVAHIGMEVENKIFNLSNTKDLLLDNLNSGLDELPDGVLKDRLYNILWQIQTIDDCIADCMTTDDFYNLDNFIFYSKELLTPKNK
nr:MAG TPA: hypothetical protein [Caudoviricetes sp.]